MAYRKSKFIILKQSSAKIAESGSVKKALYFLKTDYSSNGIVLQYLRMHITESLLFLQLIQQSLAFFQMLERRQYSKTMLHTQSLCIGCYTDFLIKRFRMESWSNAQTNHYPITTQSNDFSNKSDTYDGPYQNQKINWSAVSIGSCSFELTSFSFICLNSAVRGFFGVSSGLGMLCGILKTILQLAQGIFYYGSSSFYPARYSKKSYRLTYGSINQFASSNKLFDLLSIFSMIRFYSCDSIDRQYNYIKGIAGNVCTFCTCQKFKLKKQRTISSILTKNEMEPHFTSIFIE